MVAENPVISAEMTVLRSALAAIAEPLYKTKRNFNLRFSAVLWSRPGMDKKLLFGLLLRHGLTIAGGYATGAGIVSETDLQTATGAIVALVGIVLSAIDKAKHPK
jgi:hypothetical protein